MATEATYGFQIPLISGDMAVFLQAPLSPQVTGLKQNKTKA